MDVANSSNFSKYYPTIQNMLGSKRTVKLPFLIVIIISCDKNSKSNPSIVMIRCHYQGSIDYILFEISYDIKKKRYVYNMVHC